MTQTTDTRVWRLTPHYRKIYGDTLRTTAQVMSLADRNNPTTGSASYYYDDNNQIVDISRNATPQSPDYVVASLAGHRGGGDIVYALQDGNLVYRTPGAQYGDGSEDSNDDPQWLLVADSRDAYMIERHIEEHSDDEAAVRAALS